MWTKEQSQTIEQRDKNILVSAAAGAGKTAVLVERIKKMVTEENIPVDSMLIVTFTNAAAAEMKEKIRKALSEKVTEMPELQRQLDILPRASISTFHSFALDVIRHFFYKIDLDPDFSICDEAQSAVIREEAMDELFRNYYEEFSPGFERLLDWYGSERGDDGAKAIIRGLYVSLMAMPEPFKSLQKKIEELTLDEEEFKKTDAYGFMAEAVCETLKGVCADVRKMRDLLDEHGVSSLSNKLEARETFFEELLKSADDGDLTRVYESMDLEPNVRLVSAKDEREAYEEIKGIVGKYNDRSKKKINDMKESFFAESLPDMLLSLQKTHPIAGTIQRMLTDFDTLFSEKKREKKVMDFSDIEHFCFDILKEEDVAEYYRNRFEYIFIDEYQDTNVIQEAIVARVARDNNLFMVGDIKQSIYKFRLAEPEIFKGKYDKYADGTDEKSVKIDLNKNFRSDPAILDWVNERFKGIMDDYTEEAYLYPGNRRRGERSFPPEVRLIDMAEREDAGEALKELKAGEAEALEVCRIIGENAGKEYEVVETVDGEEVRTRKKINFRDIVVLMRAVSGNAQVYAEAMKKFGIPCYVDDSKGYFDTIEVEVFMNLLRLMDNRYRDSELISVLRSEILGFTTDELAELRNRHRNGSFAEAFIAEANEYESRSSAEKEMHASQNPRETGGGRQDIDESSGRDSIASKTAFAMRKFNTWKSWALSLPLSDFVWKLLMDTGYYLAAGAMPAGVQRQANLRALCDKSRKFEENGQSSLYGFIRYVENIDKNDIRTGQVKLLGENDDVVRIMTIHKSKGLEFPVVICAGMGKKLMYSTTKSKVAFHKDIGLGMVIENPEAGTEKKSLIYDIILKKIHREEVEENIRVLYVAFTRAKEKLYLTGTVKDAEKYIESEELNTSGDTTCLSLLGEIPDVKIVEAGSLVGKSAEQNKGTLEESETRERTDEESETRERTDEKAETRERTGYDAGPGGGTSQALEIDRRLGFTYPHAEAQEIRSKYSVSSLNRKAHTPAVLMSDSTDYDYQGGENTFKEDRKNIGIPKEQPKKGLRNGSGEATLLEPESDGEKVAEIGFDFSLPVPGFFQGNTGLSAAERGTVYHRIMEKLDFTYAAIDGKEYIEHRIAELVEKKILTENEAGSVDVGCINGFFRSEPGIRAVRAARKGLLVKEQPFNLMSERGGERIIIQGIIDCYFREGDEIVLLDYKTNRIDPLKSFDEESERLSGLYGEQMHLYKTALEEATNLKVKNTYLYLMSVGKVLELTV